MLRMNNKIKMNQIIKIKLRVAKFYKIIIIISKIIYKKIFKIIKVKKFKVFLSK
jgi:hypothetical protein